MKPDFEKINPAHVIAAAKIIDREDIPVNRRATLYEVEVNGRYYPFKYLLSVANREATGTMLGPSDFQSNVYYRGKLEELGFVIRQQTAAWFDPDIVKAYLEHYKLLLKHPAYNEAYKWEAIANFQKNWDIDAPDFGAMFAASFQPESSNLWAGQNFLPRVMILRFVQMDQERVRQMFRTLFDENQELGVRVRFFQDESMAFIALLNDPKVKNSYQQLRSVALYLAFCYPEKYYLYKLNMINGFLDKCGNLKKLNRVTWGEARNLDLYYEMANQLRELITADEELVRLNAQRLNAYPDPKYCLLTQDFIYAVATYLEHVVLDNELLLNNSRVYKISHGSNYFNDEDVRYFLERRRVCVHEQTKAKGTSFQTQGEQYMQEFHPGDLFYLCNSNHRMLLLGRITSEPETSTYMDENEGVGWKERSYEVIRYALHDEPYQDEKKWWAPSDNSTFIPVKAGELELANEVLFEPFFGIRLLAGSGSDISENTNPETIPVKSDLNPGMAKNIILYGPPGTGKTYNSIGLAAELASGKKETDYTASKKTFDRLRSEGQIVFVTFHQNYAYEDFMVGIKPELDSGALGFRQHEGVFYRICSDARKNFEAQGREEIMQRPFNEVLDEFLRPLVEEGTPIDVQMVSGNKRFTITEVNPYNLSFIKHSKGDGHKLSLETIEVLYERRRDFRRGLRSYYQPLVKKLWELGATAKKETAQLKNYVLVIDEINRANMSRVFGELITLLEDDKRLGKLNELQVRLPHSNEDFGVPPNLYVIGTMNTADKSIALVDIALRRRFEFRGFYPSEHVLAEFENSGQLIPAAGQLLRTLNKNLYLKKNRNADFLIGHAYLLNKPASELTVIIRDRIVPLLMEYLGGKTDEVAQLFANSGFTVRYNEDGFNWIISDDVV